MSLQDGVVASDATYAPPFIPDAVHVIHSETTTLTTAAKTIIPITTMLLRQAGKGDHSKNNK